MNFSKLKKVPDYEVMAWFRETIPDITPYQSSKLYEIDARDFPYQFYKRSKPIQTNLLWRLSIVFYLIWILFLVLGLPFTWLFTGDWGYNQKFLEKSHYRWQEKLRL